MRWFPKNQIDLSNFILSYRWGLMFLFGLTSISFEILEHFESGHFHVDGHFWREIIYFCFVGPIIGGYILTILFRSKDKNSQLTEQLNLENDLIQEMSNAQTWDDLTEVIICFPLKIASFFNIVLQLCKVDEAKFETVASWRDSDQLNLKPLFSFYANNTKINDHQKNGTLQGSFETSIFVGKQENQMCYSLPLINGSVPVAILHLSLSADKPLSTVQRELLINIAPAIAFAIDNLQPHGAGIVRALATQAERKRLARYLHDSLGQNLGFLVMKLDHLKGDNVLEEVGAIRQELTQMRNVANQAYEQIRSTLTHLHEPKLELVGDLDSVIRNEIKSFHVDPLFAIEITQSGIKQPLSSKIKNRILGIVREAITNIGKHAEAHKVQIYTQWSLDDVSVSIRDDGRGFDTDSLNLKKHHYGLFMMQERAQEINGRLIFKSEPGYGTEITVRVPLTDL